MSYTYEGFVSFQFPFSSSLTRLESSSNSQTSSWLTARGPQGITDVVEDSRTGLWDGWNVMEWLPGEIMVLTLHRWVSFQHKRNLDFKFLSFGQKETERLDSASRVPVRIKTGSLNFHVYNTLLLPFPLSPLEYKSELLCEPDQTARKLARGKDRV